MKTKNNVNSNNVNNETKVVCPVCGSEFEIGAHEHKVKNATVVGADSGLGTVYLPVSKRGELLKAAGIDTGKYFSIQLPTGGQQMMKMEDGKAVPVTQDDPVIKAIVGAGTVPNRSLFRRWVMSQVFHWLQDDKKYGPGKWLRWHGYLYQWEMLVEELRVQARLCGRDVENFQARNRWFNRELAVAMAADYIDQMRKDAYERPTHTCKGVPYVTFSNRNVFVSDIEKKLVEPMRALQSGIMLADTPQRLYDAVRRFFRSMYRGSQEYKQCPKWKDAYKGMGAYATMQNLLRFHGCTFPKDNAFYDRKRHGWTYLDMLEDAANTYADGKGWRLFGLMKQMIEENGIDIDAKMKEWRKAKEDSNLRR